MIIVLSNKKLKNFAKKQIKSAIFTTLKLTKFSSVTVVPHIWFAILDEMNLSTALNKPFTLITSLAKMGKHTL